MTLETLCIDAGGVIVNPNWRAVAEALARQGVDVEEAALARAELTAKHTIDQADMIRRTDDRARAMLYWDLVAAHAGVDAPRASLEAAWAEIDGYHARENLWDAVIPGVPEALASLRAQGFRLIVVSNANGTIRAKMRRLDLERRVDAILDSSELGVEKPDPRIFEIALAEAGTPATRALHVGDLYEVDVIGARRAGLRAVLIDPGNLYADRDCPRVPSLLALAEALARGERFASASS